MTEETTRRELLELAAVGALAAGVGYATRDRQPAGEALVPAGGTRNVPGADGHLLLADSFSAAADAWAADPTLAIVDGTANRWLFGDASVVVTVADVDIQIGEANHAEAQAAVDSYPTLAVTENGNIFMFTN